MLKQTKEFNLKSTVSRLKQDGFTVTLSAIAADVRHLHTNYDTYSYLLGTDDAEKLIKETYLLVVSINESLKPAMLAWGNKKLKSLK